jgi:hypothetical protein
MQTALCQYASGGGVLADALAAIAQRLARAGFLACPERVPGRGQTVTLASSQGDTARAGAASRAAVS